MKKRKKSKIFGIILCILVVLGLIGGILIKTGLYGKLMNNNMSNDEANRLISYLGIDGYEYTDRIGSSFNVAAAKKLVEAADVSYDQIPVKIEHVPGFFPLTRKQFISIYDAMVQELQLERLHNLDLYIYDIDKTKESEIDGVVYEVVSTSNGDYFMEKEYGLDNAYIGKVVNLYISNNEIILCLGESKETVTIKNAYVVKRTEEEGETALLTYVEGNMYKFPLESKKSVEEDLQNALCDIEIKNKGVVKAVSHQSELISAKVLSYADGIVMIEGQDEPVYLSDMFNVYKVHGSFKAMESAGTLIGYDQVSLYIADGILEAAIIDEEIYKKDIRVLISNNDYTGYYHKEITVTSDTDFTISYGDKTRECKAGEKVQFRNGSDELQNGVAKITSKEEEGKITINSIKRQNGSPAYRGTIELSKSDEGVMVINELPVEEYLYGVVPSEMPVSYEEEALKAQAICARAYAYNQMQSDKFAAYGAHLDDSVSSQVYNNAGEDEKTIFAVDDTYGVVPCYEDQVIEAFFFSTSCGATSNNSVVWGGNQEAYLLDTMQNDLNDLAELSNEETFRKFIDGELGTGYFEEEEPFFRWHVGFTKEKLTTAINTNLYERIKAMPGGILAKNAEGKYEEKEINSIGDLVSIEVTERGDSGIVTEMIITGTEETIKVIGQTNARAILSPADVTIRKQDGSTITGWKTLPSAYFYIDDQNGFVIRGGGFGHGVGMSQNGANNMAKLGYKASDIIKYYFIGVELKDMYELMGK